MSNHYVFGRFEVRPDERRVLDAGEPATLGARAFDLLLALIEHRDRVVGKDELLATVWPRMVVERPFPARSGRRSFYPQNHQSPRSRSRTLRG